jgi:uncharacterized protein
MYLPKHKRQFGCYVMPVLSGDRLTGRVVPRMNRKRGVLVVEGAFAEPGALPDPLLPAALESLASFAGGRSVSHEGSTAVSLVRVSRPGGRAGRRPGEEGPGSTGQGGR